MGSPGRPVLRIVQDGLDPEDLAAVVAAVLTRLAANAAAAQAPDQQAEAGARRRLTPPPAFIPAHSWQAPGAAPYPDTHDGRHP
jgi:Acyl-CoA carboxylase epsilon subunit